MGELARDFEVMAGALEAAQERLSALASQDPLTELLNHRAFQESLHAELERCRRGGMSSRSSRSTSTSSKPDVLFFEDFQAIQRHSDVAGGHHRLRRLDRDRYVGALPGYPRGDEIPLESRILAAADELGAIAAPS